MALMECHRMFVQPAMQPSIITAYHRSPSLAGPEILRNTVLLGSRRKPRFNTTLYDHDGHSRIICYILFLLRFT